MNLRTLIVISSALWVSACSMVPAKPEASLDIRKLQWQISLLDAQKLSLQDQIAQKSATKSSSESIQPWSQLRHKHQAQSITHRLFDCAEDSLANSQPVMAQQCLDAASTFNGVWGDNEALAHSHARLSTQAKQLKAKALVRARQQKASRQRLSKAHRLKSLKTDYRNQITSSHWLEAQKALAVLNREYPKDSQVQTWNQELNDIIGAQVQEAIKEGRRLYSQGSLEGALQVWRTAAQLAPDNGDLHADIKRAERFWSKLQKLDS